MRGKTTCRSCESTELFQALNLGFSPLANRVLIPAQLDMAESFYPLDLRVCRTCGLGQLGEFANSSEIFRDYAYLSSTSSSWINENRIFAEELEQILDLTDTDVVVEIASNDGYLLTRWAEKGLKVLGIEPALNVATIAAWAGVPTSPEFFGTSLSNELVKMGVLPRLIVAKNVVAHVPDLTDFLTGLSVLATERSLIVIEAPTIDQVLVEKQFDTIYHEHFSYLSVQYLQQSLPRFGLELAGIEKVKTHGGSTRFFVTKAGSEDHCPAKFAANLKRAVQRDDFEAHLDEKRWVDMNTWFQNYKTVLRKWIEERSETIIGYGAAAKAVTLLSSAEIPRNSIQFIIDNAKTKQGRYLPGHHSQIISEEMFTKMSWSISPTFLVFPWNLGPEIKNRVRQISPDSKVFVPLPEIKEI